MRKRGIKKVEISLDIRENSTDKQRLMGNSHSVSKGQERINLPQTQTSLWHYPPMRLNAPFVLTKTAPRESTIR